MMKNVLTQNQLKNVSDIFKLLSFGKRDLDSLIITYEESNLKYTHMFEYINVCDAIASILYIGSLRKWDLCNSPMGIQLKIVCFFLGVSITKIQIDEVKKTYMFLHRHGKFPHKVYENELTGIILACEEYMQETNGNRGQKTKVSIH